VAVGTNVAQESRPFQGKSPPDQQATVAGGGVLFAAHDRHAVLGAASEEPAKSALKGDTPRPATVQHSAVLVVVLVSVRPPSQILTKEEVPDTHSADELRKRKPGEVREVSSIGIGPHIHQDLNLVLVEEVCELGRRIIGVSDGKHLDRGGFGSVHTS